MNKREEKPSINVSLRATVCLDFGIRFERISTTYFEYYTKKIATVWNQKCRLFIREQEIHLAMNNVNFYYYPLFPISFS